MLPGTEGPPLLKCMQNCITFEAVLLTSRSLVYDLIDFDSEKRSGATERMANTCGGPSSASFLMQMS